MIDTTNLTAGQLADAWRPIRATSPADEADPLVLECARRLIADPGGEQAHLWVAGLVAMTGYLAWRPGPAAERAARGALRAAAEVLGERPCPHDSHPYEARMDSLEDEVWAGRTSLVGERPTGTGPVLCPGNVAGWARLALDVIAPFTVRRIPAGAPAYHHSRIKTLSGIVNDYPYDSPRDVLADEATFLPSRPTRGVLAGYLVTMHATCWYAASGRITDRSVLEAMIKGIGEGVRLLGDSPCDHAPGGHPDTDDPDCAGSVGYLLRSPGGRAEMAEDHGWGDDEGDDGAADDEPLDAWVCPAFLRDLADEALATLTDALEGFAAAEDEDNAEGTQAL